MRTNGLAAVGEVCCWPRSPRSPRTRTCACAGRGLQPTGSGAGPSTGRPRAPRDGSRRGGVNRVLTTPTIVTAPMPRRSDCHHRQPGVAAGPARPAKVSKVSFPRRDQPRCAHRALHLGDPARLRKAACRAASGERPARWWRRQLVQVGPHLLVQLVVHPRAKKTRHRLRICHQPRHEPTTPGPAPSPRRRGPTAAALRPTRSSRWPSRAALRRCPFPEMNVLLQRWRAGKSEPGLTSNVPRSSGGWVATRCGALQLEGLEIDQRARSSVNKATHHYR